MQPISIEYVLEYPADAPQLRAYADRLRRDRIFEAQAMSPDDSQMPQPFDEESAAIPVIAMNLINLKFLRDGSQEEADLWLNASVLSDVPLVDGHFGKAPHVTTTVRVDGNVIRQTIYDYSVENITPAQSTLVSRLDLIGTTLIVTIVSPAPAETRLRSVGFRFGTKLGRPIRIFFDDSSRVGRLPDTPRRRGISFKRKLTSSDLGIDIPDA